MITDEVRGVKRPEEPKVEEKKFSKFTIGTLVAGAIAACAYLIYGIH